MLNSHFPDLIVATNKITGLVQLLCVQSAYFLLLQNELPYPWQSLLFCLSVLYNHFLQSALCSKLKKLLKYLFLKLKYKILDNV
jgi:hypothetical protein